MQVSSSLLADKTAHLTSAITEKSRELKNQAIGALRKSSYRNSRLRGHFNLKIADDQIQYMDCHRLMQSSVDGIGSSLEISLSEKLSGIRFLFAVVLKV